MKNTIVILLILFTINCSKVQPNDNTDRPNVVLIIADDVSSDFSCFNGQVHTPNIDQLAEHGVRIKNGPIEKPTNRAGHNKLESRKPKYTSLFLENETGIHNERVAGWYVGAT